MSHALALSPTGHLFVEPDEQAEPMLSQTAAARLTQAFSESSARGLELLAGEFLDQPLSPTFVFWRGLAQRFFTALCHNPNLESAANLSIVAPPETEWAALAETAPPMKGLEYLNAAVCHRLRRISSILFWPSGSSNRATGPAWPLAERELQAARAEPNPERKSALLQEVRAAQDKRDGLTAMLAREFKEASGSHADPGSAWRSGGITFHESPTYKLLQAIAPPGDHFCL